MNLHGFSHFGLAACLGLAATLPFSAWPEDRAPLESPCACDTPAARSSVEILPPVRREGDVRYRTGGIGRVEAAAMRSVRPQYPLAVTFLVREREALQYTSRVSVQIDRADGARMLGLTTDGPMLLADVPPGGYHIIAVDDRGRVQSRDLAIREGEQQAVSFVWPSR